MTSATALARHALLGVVLLGTTPALAAAQDAQHAARHGQAAAVTTVVLVRHAEKAAEPPRDPPLTETGRVRAHALLEALGDARVAAVYSTDYARTRDTARPLADAAGVPVTLVTAGGADYIAEVARRARTEHPGEVVVIVGHSNTLGPTIAALGGPDDVGALPDDAYDRFFIVLLRDGEPARLIRARYGAASPP